MSGDAFDKTNIANKTSKGAEWLEHRVLANDTNASPIYGRYGAYPMTEGHFFCFHPYELGTPEDVLEYYENMIVKEGRMNRRNTRGLILTSTFYHQESDYYLNMNVLVEKSVTGNLEGTKLEVTPFQIF